MARIRSVKPEFWIDPKITRVSRDARLLYIALWNASDEHGRLHGDPRVIKGHAFPYDDDLPAVEISRLVSELAGAGKVRRYAFDGEDYLFLPNLHKHQRLEPKVESRLPAPPDVDEYAWGTDESESSVVAPGMSTSVAIPEPHADFSASDADSRAEIDASLCGREQVAGGREQVSAATPRADDSAHALVGEWLDHCKERPPARVVGQTSKEVKQLLDEGIDPQHVRAGLAEWHFKGQHPSTLPSFVNAAMNTGTRSTTDRKVSQTAEMAARFREQEAQDAQV